MIYTCIKYPLPGLVHIIGNNYSHLSLNHQYVSSIVDPKIDENRLNKHWRVYLVLGV